MILQPKRFFLIGYLPVIRILASNATSLREIVKIPASNLSLIFVKVNPAYHSTAA